RVSATRRSYGSVTGAQNLLYSKHMRFLAPLLLAVAVGCTASAEDDVGGSDDALTDPHSVAGAALHSCTTATVSGLAEQLVAEMQCIKPGVLVKIDLPDNVTLEPEVFPYLQAPAADALRNAATAYARPMQINSALRTLPQQYMLKRWDL